MLQIDKILHFIMGWLIVLSIIPIYGIVTGIIALVIAAVGKEIYDQWKYKGFDYKDLIATLLGGLVYIIIQICK